MQLIEKLIGILAVIGLLFSCVPIRKQLILTDNSKYSLKQKQMMDTIVPVLPYEYKIKKSDILSVIITSITPGEYRMDQVAKAGGDVAGNEAGYVVNDTGYIDLPVIGLVKVGGLSLDKARDLIRATALSYLNNVTVSVRLQNFEVTLLGEIGNITLKSANGRLTVVEAIAKAGGASEFANIKKIKIIRQGEIQDKVHVFYVDISDVGIISRPEYFLMPKDILVVEPLKAKNARSVRYAMGFATASVSAILLLYSLYTRFNK